MTTPYPDPASSPSATPTKRGAGCAKWAAILGSSFLIFTGLVTACGPDTVETEIPGPTITQTVTSTITATPSTRTVTETTTVEPTPEETVQEEVEPAAVEEAPAPANNVNVPQRAVSIPDPLPAQAPAPAPAPDPAPAPIGRTITGGAFCKKTEVGQVGYTTAGTALTCSLAPGDSRARWR